MLVADGGMVHEDRHSTAAFRLVRAPSKRAAGCHWLALLAHARTQARLNTCAQDQAPALLCARACTCAYAHTRIHTQCATRSRAALALPPPHAPHAPAHAQRAAGVGRGAGAAQPAGAAAAGPRAARGAPRGRARARRARRACGRAGRAAAVEEVGGGRLRVTSPALRARAHPAADSPCMRARAPAGPCCTGPATTSSRSPTTLRRGWTGAGAWPTPTTRARVRGSARCARVCGCAWVAHMHPLPLPGRPVLPLLVCPPGLVRPRSPIARPS